MPDSLGVSQLKGDHWSGQVALGAPRRANKVFIMSDMNRKNILILEADRDVSELFARAIEVRRDCKCYLAGGEEEAFDLMQDIPFALALVDLSIAMEGDFRLLKKIKKGIPGDMVSRRERLPAPKGAP